MDEGENQLKFQSTGLLFAQNTGHRPEVISPLVHRYTIFISKYIPKADRRVVTKENRISRVPKPVPPYCAYGYLVWSGYYLTEMVEPGGQGAPPPHCVLKWGFTRTFHGSQDAALK